MPRPVDAGRGGRHYLLYARQNWRDMRFLLIGLTFVYVGFGVYEGIQAHNLAVGFRGTLIAILPPIMLVAIYAYTRFCWVEMAEDGIQVHFPIRRALVPYTEVEKARLDTLRNLFDRPENKRMATGTVKRLYDQKALCVRLRDDDDLPATLRRKLGPRTVLDRELILAVSDSDVAYGELKQRLLARRQRPVEAGAEAGGGRRRRGRRGGRHR